MGVKCSDLTFHSTGRSMGRSWTAPVQPGERERMNVSPPLQAAWGRQGLSSQGSSAPGLGGHSGNRSLRSRPGRHAMPPEARTTSWRPSLSLRDAAGKLHDPTRRPRGRVASASCLPPKSETRLDHLSYTASRTGRYFAIRVDNEAAGLACGFSISLLPPFHMISKQSGKENVPPVDKVRFGGITASIYANDVQDMPIPVYKVTVSRTYVVNGAYKTATAFRQEDLPYLQYALHEAWVRIEQMKQQAWEASRKDAPKEANESEAGEE